MFPRRSSRRNLVGICALAALLVPVSHGIATPIDGSEVYVYDSRLPGADPAGPFITGQPSSFQLPKFDDAVKIFAFGEWHERKLVAVTVNVTAFIQDGYVYLDNEDAAPAEVLDVVIGVQVRVTSDTPDAPLVVVTFPKDQTSGTMAGDDDATPDFVGADSIGVIADGDADANSATIDVANDPIKIAPWVGAGEFVTWNFDANSRMFAEIRPSVAPVTVLQSPLSHMVAEVHYHWQVAPEPASALMLGIGSAACVLRRRRRIRQIAG